MFPRLNVGKSGNEHGDILGLTVEHVCQSRSQQRADGKAVIGKFEQLLLFLHFRLG